MIQDIEARSRGVWRPGPGSVHPALQQLEDECLMAGDDSGGAAPWDEVARTVPEDRHELRLLWAQLAEAFGHLARTGDDRQVAEARELLRRTRRSVFQILAEDP